MCVLNAIDSKFERRKSMKKTNLVELFIYSQKMKSKDGKKTWIKYSTKANFKMEDGTLAPHYIDVKFTEDAFNDSPVTLKDIKRGILKVDGKYIGCPVKWEVLTNEDGSKTYPVCFIRGGIESFTPVEKEHQFNFILDEEVDETTIEEQE